MYRAVTTVCAAVFAAAFLLLAPAHARSYRADSGLLRIVYSSDWSGESQIYSADAFGRGVPGQLTFGASVPAFPGATSGSVRPLPSPDGRKLLYWRSGLVHASLFVSGADGASRHRLALVNGSVWDQEAVWAPNSRRVAYVGTDGVHVAAADGSGDRRLFVSGRGLQWSPDGGSLALVLSVPQSSGPAASYLMVSSGFASRAALRTIAPIAGSAGADFAWSPSGDRIAYLDTSRGISLAQLGGHGHRELAIPASSGESFSSPVWSRDGHTLAFDDSVYHAGATAGSSFIEDRVETVDTGTGRLRALVRNARELVGLAWSPDGRRLAFSAEGGIQVVDAGAGTVRLVSHDRSIELVWSPDGRSLAYVQAGWPANGLDYSGDLRVTQLSGHVRTIVAAAGTAGGVISGIAWTRPPAGLRYRSPQPRTVATVTANQLDAPYPIEALAADGNRVAYGSCRHAFVWTPSTGSVIQADAVASLACHLDQYQCCSHITSIALAGDRLAYSEFSGLSSKTIWLGGTTLTAPPHGFVLDEGGDELFANGQLPPVAGSGQLLLYEHLGVDQSSGDPYPTTAELHRVGATGCDCPVIATVRASSSNDLPIDVDNDRVLVAGGDSLLLFDANGKQLLSIPIHTTSAALAGPDIVAYDSSTLRGYDAQTGALLHTWPLSSTTDHFVELQDAAQGLVAYSRDGQVHVLRLTDGRDATVGTGGLARFTDTGLVYADGSRLRLIPYDRMAS